MTRPSLISMAWRNLWRNRRRTLLTLSSIAFGVLLAVLMTGAGDMNWRDMIDMAARLGAGHVTIQHQEYVDSPTLSRTVRASDALSETLSLDEDVGKVVTRISGAIMLATAAQSYGAGFIAIDPEGENFDTLSILEAMHEGQLFESTDARSIVLGARLAENLDAGIGRKVVFTLTDKNGEIVRDVVRVSGIIRTGAPSVDGGLALLPIDRMRAALGYAPDEATHVGLFLNDQRRADSVAERLGPKIGEAATLAWHETQPDVAAFIAMKIAGARMMQVIIATLVAAGIFNTLFVSVMERLREFGILMAVGFSPGRLFRLVMFESAWFGVLGLVAAALVTVGPYYYLAQNGIDISAALGDDGQAEVAGIGMSPVLRFGIYGSNLAIIAIAALSATMLAGLYPAWRAARVAPVESIRLV